MGKNGEQCQSAHVRIEMALSRKVSTVDFVVDADCQKHTKSKGGKSIKGIHKLDHDLPTRACTRQIDCVHAVDVGQCELDLTNRL